MLSCCWHLCMQRYSMWVQVRDHCSGILPGMRSDYMLDHILCNNGSTFSKGAYLVWGLRACAADNWSRDWCQQGHFRPCYSNLSFNSHIGFVAVYQMFGHTRVLCLNLCTKADHHKRTKCDRVTPSKGVFNPSSSDLTGWWRHTLSSCTFY